MCGDPGAHIAQGRPAHRAHEADVCASFPVPEHRAAFEFDRISFCDVYRMFGPHAQTLGN